MFFLIGIKQYGPVINNLLELDIKFQVFLDYRVEVSNFVGLQSKKTFYFLCTKIESEIFWLFKSIRSSNFLNNCLHLNEKSWVSMSLNLFFFKLIDLFKCQQKYIVCEHLNVDRKVLFIEVSLKCYPEEFFSSCKVWQLQRWEVG